MAGVRVRGGAFALAAMMIAQCAPSEPRATKTAHLTQNLAWSKLAAPKRAFTGHTATLLGDGRVLIAGGDAAGNATEIFDPRTGAFADGPKLLAARTHHTATMLQSGKVLLVGGDGQSSAELFDPVTGTVAMTGALGGVRAHHAAARLLDGRVLIGGGPQGDSTPGTLYDPATGTFSAAPGGGVGADPVMVVLPSGKVLFLAADAGAQIFDPDAKAWQFPPSQPMGTMGKRGAALLQDGRVIVLSAEPGVGIVGPASVQFFNPAGSTFSAPSGFITSTQIGMVATVLPSGRVLFSGGVTSVSKAVVYDPKDGSFGDDDTGVAHRDSTATSLPGGDVLLVGGDFPAADIRTWPGGVLPGESAIPMVTGRARHVAALLPDGKVLLAGGDSRPESQPTTDLASAEIFDPVAKSFSPVSSAMSQTRSYASAVVLPSGKVLVMGGEKLSVPSASADVFDPANVSFHPAASAMVASRGNFAAARLANGEVLATGGNAGTSTDLFDPAKETFRIGPATVLAHAYHGLVRLADGRLLLVDKNGAEIYDPKTGAFRATAAPRTDTAGRTARLLPSGKVFASTEGEIANQIFDPATETWAAAPALPLSTRIPVWGMTPEGSPLMTGAVRGYSINGAEPSLFLFDPLVTSGTAVIAYAPGAPGRYLTTATVVPSARTLITGGDTGGGSVFGPINDTAILYGDTAPDAARPVLQSVPANATGGDTILITGRGFGGADTPLAIWMPDLGDAVVRVRVASFSDTKATLVVPASAFAGRGFLHVSVGGITSNALPLAIAPGQQAAACRFDADCASGACADGVCCDRACGGKDKACEACSAARKGSGVDGVCGVIPFGRDTCLAPNGEACSEGSHCASGSCSGGVCCDSECKGACLSCTEAGSVGTCRAVERCGLTCDGDHTLKQDGAPDVDCAPFTCDGTACRTRCASVNDCVAPAVCALDGTCVVLTARSGSEQSLLGCAFGGVPVEASGGMGLAALGVGCALRRRRRRTS
jgi:hypothetical protein